MPLRALIVCLALAAVSLSVAQQPTYDPLAWLIWGRQISEGTLHTVAGPSWKPLSVLFTAPFSLLGDDAARSLWLVVARTGGLLAIVLAFVLARRLGGTLAGVVAALALALANQFAVTWFRGNSEGLLVALAFAAILCHLDGRRWAAFAFGAAAGLVRPEVWLFLALYGMWIAFTDARRMRALAVVTGTGLLVALSWFVPEYIGSGDFLRAANRAREPVPDSPAQADHPFLAVFSNSAQALSYPVYAGAVLAFAFALRRRRQSRELPVLAIAFGSAVLMLIVAVLAQGGFTGNLRYVTLPAALLCVLAGVGYGRLAGELRRRLGRGAAALAGAALVLGALPGVLLSLETFRDNAERARAEERLYDELDLLVERAGGRAALRRCGQVFTGPFQTQAVAWRLHVRQVDVGLDPVEPATILAPRRLDIARRPGYRQLAGTRRWVALVSCEAAR